MINRVSIEIIIYSTVLLLLTGCGKTYTGDENSRDTGLEPLDEDIPVMLAISDPVYSMLTRGSGAFDSELSNATEMWKNAVFYIYAFKMEDDVDFRFLSRDNNEHCLVDGSIDKDGSKMGKRARLNGDRASYLSWIDSSEIFYDRENQTRPYRFFGFYIDDLSVKESDIERTADAVKIKVQVDGTQDIMSTVATLTDEQKEVIRRSDNRELTMKSLYSAYTARQGVHPVLAFHHQLARVKFKMFSASEASDNIYVESLSVDSKTDGVFTVAAKDAASIGLDFTNSTIVKPLLLCELGGESLKQDYYKVSWIPEEADKDVYERTGVGIGESLLLPPDMDVYKMKLCLKQIFPGQSPKSYNLFYDLKVNGRFQAGMQYTVRIAVYGLEDADVRVVVDGWREGESIEISPDDWVKQEQIK